MSKITPRVAYLFAAAWCSFLMVGLVWWFAGWKLALAVFLLYWLTNFLEKMAQPPDFKTELQAVVAKAMQDRGVEPEFKSSPHPKNDN